MNNEIIIIGGNSFAGKTLIPHLLPHFDRIHIVSRSDVDIQSTGNIHVYITNDLCSKNVKQAVRGCNTCFYFASATTPAASALDPVMELQLNINPLINFLEVTRQQENFTLYYVSSGGTIYGNAVSGPIDETQPFSPRSYYAAGKIAGEAFVHAFSRQTGNNTVILRPSNFYGVGQPLARNFGVIRTIFQHILEDKPMTIWGDGENKRDFLYIEDFASACLFLLKTPACDKVMTFNVSSGVSLNLNQICETIEKITSKKLTRDYQPIRQIDVKNVELDSSKLRGLGWKPAVDIESGLKLMWEWIKTQ